MIARHRCAVKVDELACTGITVKTTDGSVVSARTLEFADDIHSNAILIPRGYAMSAVLPDGRPELTRAHQPAPPCVSRQPCLPPQGSPRMFSRQP